MKNFVASVILGCVVAITSYTPLHGMSEDDLGIVTFSALIAEVSTADQDGSGNEFVEISLITNDLVDLDGLILQYKSATGANWINKAKLEGTSTHGSILIATELYEQTAYHVMSSGLAGTRGHVRLVYEVDETITVLDTVGWGESDSPETTPSLAASSSQSLKRLVDEDGRLIDTDDNLNDFFISDFPTPQSSGYRFTVEEKEIEEDQTPTETEVGIDRSNDVDEETDAPQPFAGTFTEVTKQQNSGAVSSSQETSNSTASQSYSKIAVTELFIDPGKPLLDSEDEFVELYNPNDTPVNLDGYQVQAGSTYRYKFTFPDYKIGSGEYFALYSVDSNLTLSNSEGRVRILDPNGNVVSETESYEKAKENRSWQLYNGSWQWSVSPSPSRTNVLSLPSSSSSTSTTKTNSSTASSAKKVVSLTSSADKAKTTDYPTNESDKVSENQDKRTVYEEPDPADDSELNKPILVGVGSLTLLYMGYEYRTDIGNRFFQLKSYIRNWRGNRE